MCMCNECVEPRAPGLEFITPVGSEAKPLPQLLAGPDPPHGLARPVPSEFVSVLFGRPWHLRLCIEPFVALTLDPAVCSNWNIR